MSDDEQPETKGTFLVGDNVCVSTTKLTIKKSYETKYWEKIFKVIEVIISREHFLFRIYNLADKVKPGCLNKKRAFKSNSEREKNLESIKS